MPLARILRAVSLLLGALLVLAACLGGELTLPTGGALRSLPAGDPGQTPSPAAVGGDEASTPAGESTTQDGLPSVETATLEAPATSAAAEDGVSEGTAEATLPPQLAPSPSPAPIGSLLEPIVGILKLPATTATTATPAPMSAPTPTPAGPAIIAEPQQALNDTPIQLSLSGLPPGQKVTLRADLAGLFVSSATFSVGADGRVDLSRQAPLSGSYDQADPMGLFLAAGPLAQSADAPGRGLTEGYAVTLTAESAGQTLARTTVERLFLAPGTTRRDVREQGLVGTYFRPSGAGPFPALLLVGGTDDDPHLAAASLLASRGYAVLSLSYFAEPGLPEHYEQIPLEYFERALAWLQSQDAVARGHLGVIGWSAGGQLALLLGATFPDIKAVVAYSPAGVVSEGDVDNIWSGHSRFTYRGQPVPYVPGYFLERWGNAFRARLAEDGNLQAALDATMAELLQDPDYARGVIPVEQTQGPVLLISAGQDASWASTLLAEISLRRLKEKGHAYADAHLIYEQAGHFIGTPYGPVIPDSSAGVERYLAGTTWGGVTALAGADAWPKVLQLLHDRLG
jgi:dienelactone hydrolase